MWRGWVAGWVVGVVCVGAFGQDAPGKTVAEAQRRLLQVTVSEVETDAPAAAQAGIRELKAALGRETDAVMAGLPAARGVGGAQQALLARMPPEDVGKIDWSKPQTGPANDDAPVAGLFGGELHVSVSEPKAGLLLVRESFGIACGDDTVLLGYERQDGAWRRVLVWESGPYKEISGAFGGGYETMLLKAERAGHPLLLVVHGTPWCTSVISHFDMDVLEVGGSAKPFWHGGHDYRIEESEWRLSRTADGWEVRASVSSFGDGGGRVERKGVMRYAVTADGVRRVEPLAMNARDSVEEWLGLPRGEAAAFADGPAGSLLWRMWETFTFEGKSETEQRAVPLASVGAVRACGDAKEHFQVEVTSEVFEGKTRPGPTFYVQLREVANGYRMHAATTTADAACGGPDLMAGR